MSNKIDGSLPPASPHVGSERIERRSATQGEPRPAGRHDDSVSLTDTARLLKRVEETLARTPEIDRQRVDSLKQAIANGEFQVDPRRIAAQVLRLEHELIG